MATSRRDCEDCGLGNVGTEKAIPTETYIHVSIWALAPVRSVRDSSPHYHGVKSKSESVLPHDWSK